ncbi:MAG: hypothetical protein AB1489_35695 [Acidobacteriota bacterium]
MNTKNRKIEKHPQTKPVSKKQIEKNPNYITLPATRAEKSDPEAVWGRPSWDPDVGDENQEEARIITDATTRP